MGPAHHGFNGLRADLNQAHVHTDKARRQAVQTGELRNAAGFSRSDLLIPTAGTGDGFEDGLTAGVGGNAGIADDESQGSTLLNVAEGTVERDDRQQTRCRWVGTKKLVDQRGHAQIDLYVRRLDHHALDDGLQ